MDAQTVHVCLCEHSTYPNADPSICVCVFRCAAKAEMADVLRFIDFLDHYLII